MAKTFSTPVEATPSERAAESKRVNEIIRSGRGRSVTLPITGDKVAKGMGNFIRAAAGRGVSDPVVAAALAKADEFDVNDANPRLVAALEKMTDEQLEEALAEAEKSEPKRGRGRPSGSAGAGMGAKYPRRRPVSVSNLIRHVAKERRRLTRIDKENLP